ncbi:hypothetical protein nbrc107696_05260 [Gordonia spumicola]|uniref:Uncharacterized protein n=1 Tax=Gordonia spumicola TaxID=589161 RepID=A0A7I9V4X1_9ACTN|nr:hypothetical protein nbrc107696_05260 [Gordonia spumicola]
MSSRSATRIGQRAAESRTIRPSPDGTAVPDRIMPIAVDGRGGVRIPVRHSVDATCVAFIG